jgi:hypothetical protein
MKSILAVALLVLFLIFTASCASIIKGSDQTVQIRSEPPEASVKVINMRTNQQVASGSTPLALTLSRGAGYFKSSKYQVLIEKAGYQKAEYALEGGANGWYIGGNIIFGGLNGWLGVDPATGAMWTLQPEEQTTKLLQAPQEQKSPVIIKQ